MMLVGFQHSDALDEIIKFAGDMELVGSKFSNSFFHPFKTGFRVGSFGHGNSAQ